MVVHIISRRLLLLTGHSRGRLVLLHVPAVMHTRAASTSRSKKSTVHGWRVSTSRKNKSAVHGWVCCDKPVDERSTASVDHARRTLKTKKVGHCGTLDSGAEGVLPLAVGACTKFIDYLPTDKEYKATVRFGVASLSNDASEPTSVTGNCDWLTHDLVEAAIPQFVGTIAQHVPHLSAVHIDGKRLHAVVRDLIKDCNQSDFSSYRDILPPVASLPCKQVHTSNIAVEAFRGGAQPEVDMRVQCNSGVYIRSLARDLGVAIGEQQQQHQSLRHAVDAIVTNLQRTRSNGFTLASAVPLGDLSMQCVLPGDTPFQHLPKVALHVPRRNLCHDCLAALGAASGTSTSKLAVCRTCAGLMLRDLYKTSVPCALVSDNKPHNTNTKQRLVSVYLALRGTQHDECQPHMWWLGLGHVWVTAAADWPPKYVAFTQRFLPAITGELPLPQV